MHPMVLSRSLLWHASVIAVGLYLMGSSVSLQAESVFADIATYPALHSELEPGSACSPISRDLGRGDTDTDSDEDVSKLQHFLAVEYGLDSADIETGFYGDVTKRYVAQFQKEHGLPDEDGVGASTRERINFLCNTEDGGAFSLSTTSGEAPFSVAFYTNVSAVGGTYMLDYGDGEISPVPVCMQQECFMRSSTKYTYQKPGIYTASIIRTTADGAKETLGSIDIEARVPPGSRPEHIVVEGPSAILANQGGMWRVIVSAGDGSPLNYSVSWGDGSKSESIAHATTTDTRVHPTLPHLYKRAGTYTAEFKVWNAHGEVILPVRIDVGASLVPICPIGTIQGDFGCEPYMKQSYAPIDMLGLTLGGFEFALAALEYGVMQ